MDAIEHLQAQVWTKPDYYGGFSPDGDYLILSRHRDSSLLDECNWESACESLKAEAYDEGSKGFATRPNVYHWRAGCSLVGWIEYLCIRSDAPEELLTQAGEIVCALADYPILDEERYSEAEFNAVCEYWERCSVRDRLDYLQRANISVFAARREELPDDPSGALFEQLREGL